MQLSEGHTVDNIVTAFDNHFLGRTNETYERYVFNMRGQKLDESFEGCVASLRIMMKSCNFCDLMKDSLLRDRFVLAIRDSVTRERLLQEPSLTVQLYIDKCRAAETTNLQLRNMKSDEASSDTFAISSRGKKHGAKSKKKADCKCAQSHILKKEECPAWGKNT